MAKKVYHIPLEKTLTFMQEHKTKLKQLLIEPKLLEYNKLLGKSYYTLEIERFIEFFKIDKELGSALKTLEYFHSSTFLEGVFKLLNLKANKDVFYAFCYILYKEKPELFELFFQKIFLHFHSSFNSTSKINIDYKDMALTLAKSKKLTLKESFGEDELNAYFKILLDDNIVIDERGKLIKTLRKKAYKKLFYYLLDLHS
jgi:hypothetical protein